MIISNRFELPWDAPLFTDGGGRVVIFTASDREPPETATPVTVVRHADGVELDRALDWLRNERGICSVLCEGGPTLHGRGRELGSPRAANLPGASRAMRRWVRFPDRSFLHIVLIQDLLHVASTRSRMRVRASVCKTFSVQQAG